jgi:hypothetical protein
MIRSQTAPDETRLRNYSPAFVPITFRLRGFPFHFSTVILAAACDLFDSRSVILFGTASTEGAKVSTHNVDGTQSFIRVNPMRSIQSIILGNGRNIKNI